MCPVRPCWSKGSRSGGRPGAARRGSSGVSLGNGRSEFGFERAMVPRIGFKSRPLRENSPIQIQTLVAHFGARFRTALVPDLGRSRSGCLMWSSPPYRSQGMRALGRVWKEGRRSKEGHAAFGRSRLDRIRTAASPAHAWTAVRSRPRRVEALEESFLQRGLRRKAAAVPPGRCMMWEEDQERRNQCLN